jgi:hypothetical protein
LLHHHYEAGVHAVFRLQQCSASAIRDFWQGPQVDTTVTLIPSARTMADIAKAHPDLTMVPRQMRLVKYQIAEQPVCLGTTLVSEQDRIPLQALMDLYHARWGVEELYKVSKRLFLIEAFHAQHERGVKQELFAHFVLITMNRLFAHHADQHLNPAARAESDAPPSANDLPPPTSTALRIKTNFQNCIHVIARKMEPLLLLHANLSRAISTAFQLIVRRHHKIRPGRSYPRQSMRPESKWRPEVDPDFRTRG